MLRTKVSGHRLIDSCHVARATAMKCHQAQAPRAPRLGCTRSPTQRHPNPRSARAMAVQSPAATSWDSLQQLASERAQALGAACRLQQPLSRACTQMSIPSSCSCHLHTDDQRRACTGSAMRLDNSAARPGLTLCIRRRSTSHLRQTLCMRGARLQQARRQRARLHAHRTLLGIVRLHAVPSMQVLLRTQTLQTARPTQMCTRASLAMAKMRSGCCFTGTTRHGAIQATA